MANIMDYIDWRGDLQMSQSAFNEVDNLILAQLSYVNFEGIVPSINSKESISLQEASYLFFTIHSEEEVLAEVSWTKMSAFLMKKMAQCKRFANLKLSKYVNRINYDEQKQFSALNVSLDDGTVYVAYRGTDNTLIGWKENFNMSFITPVPAQIEAMDYLEKTVGGLNKKIRIGGHSKGGNLAIYAAVKCSDLIKENIIEIYNNDGPGFDAKMIASKEYQQMLSRIRTIVPQSSIVGMLLEHEEEYVIVKSSQNGLMQHDAMTWEVMGKQFVYVNHISNESKILDVTLKSWINRMEQAEREQFVDSLFYVFDTAHVRKLGDFSRDKWKKMSEMIKIVGNMAPENREILIKTIKVLFDESNKVLWDWSKRIK